MGDQTIYGSSEPGRNEVSVCETTSLFQAMTGRDSRRGHLFNQPGAKGDLAVLKKPPDGGWLFVERC